MAIEDEAVHLYHNLGFLKGLKLTDMNLGKESLKIRGN